MKSDRVIVFIQDITPTDEEKALAKEHDTKSFVTLSVSALGAPLKHKYAVCVEGAKLPAGYTSFEEFESGVVAEEAEQAPPVTSINPTTGNTPPWTANTKALASDSDDSGEE